MPRATVSVPCPLAIAGAFYQVFGTALTAFGSESGTQSISFADVDGDGDADAFRGGEFWTSETGTLNSISDRLPKLPAACYQPYPGSKSEIDGTTPLVEACYLDGQADTMAAAFGDFDGDGLLDMYAHRSD